MQQSEFSQISKWNKPITHNILYFPQIPKVNLPVSGVKLFHVYKLSLVTPQGPRRNGIGLSYHPDLGIPKVVSIGSTANRLKLTLAEVKFHLNPNSQQRVKRQQLAAARSSYSDDVLSSSFWVDRSLNSGCILQIFPSDMKLYLQLMCSSIEINIAEGRGGKGRTRVCNLSCINLPCSAEYFLSIWASWRWEVRTKAPSLSGMFWSPPCRGSNGWHPFTKKNLCITTGSLSLFDATFCKLYT